MERRIDLSNVDLDACHAVVATRLVRWGECGLRLNSLTWMDNASSWPRPLIDDRSKVLSPMSLGLRLDRDDGAEVEIVVYAGGWLDAVTWVPGREPIQKYHEIDDPGDFAQRLDEAVSTLIH